MKVIRHLKHDRVEYRVQHFLRQTPLMTRVMIPTLVSCSIVLAIAGGARHFRWFSFVDARPVPELIVLVLSAITDFPNEQRRGTVFFVLSYILKIAMLALVNTFVSFLVWAFGGPADWLPSTSYPLCFVLMTAFRDMVEKPSEQRYFLAAPLRIKCLFYPVGLTALLQAMGLRIDIVIVLVLALVLSAARFDNVVVWVSLKIDQKLLSDKTTRFKIIGTGLEGQELSQIDKINTSQTLEQN